MLGSKVARINFSMMQKALIGFKGFSTMFAIKGSLSTVRVFMIQHGIFRTERFRAQGTLEWFVIVLLIDL